jgi:hypothetical protein
LEFLGWLNSPSALMKVTGKLGISQARARLGDDVVRRTRAEAASETIHLLFAPTGERADSGR